MNGAPLAPILAAARARSQGWHVDLAEALRLERAPRSVVDDAVAEKLRRVVRHASQRTTFWRERFAEDGIDPGSVRTPADLVRLRPLEKEELRTRGLDLLADGKVDLAWLRNASGGSTGTPVTFYQDADYRRGMIADQARHVTWTGLPWWTPRAFAWGADRDSRDHSGLAARVKDTLAGTHFLNTFRANDEDYREFARRCAQASVPLLVGYASSLDHLARLGTGRWRPRAVQSSAERLSAEARERIEHAFGCRVFDRYGSREMGNAAHECEMHAGLHVSMERVVIEVVRNGRVVADGEEGELLVTVLDNLAQPLIRYRIGDVGRKLRVGDCACGRSYERIEITAGRVSDLFTSPSGRRVHGEYFTHLFYGIVGIRAFHVVQETRARVVLEVVPEEGFEERLLAPVVQGIRELDPGFEVEIRSNSALPQSASGKMRFTTSQVPVEW